MSETPSKGQRTRSRIAEAALTLLEERGPHGTGINDIIARSAAPAGSLYFHFKGGKTDVVLAALHQGGRTVRAAIAEAFETAPSPDRAISHLAAALAARLKASNFTKSCPVTNVALSGADDATRDACAAIYDDWQAAFADGLRRHGLGAAQAESASIALLSGLEGALAIARARHDAALIGRVAETIMTAVLPPPARQKRQGA